MEICVEKVKKRSTEVGILITNQWKKELYKNIDFENIVSVYILTMRTILEILMWIGNYNLLMVVNEYVKANIGMRLIYDDDIKYKEEIDGVQVTKGPRVQIKQMLGVGIQYKF